MKLLVLIVTGKNKCENVIAIKETFKSYRDIVVETYQDKDTLECDQYLHALKYSIKSYPKHHVLLLDENMITIADKEIIFDTLKYMIDEHRIGICFI